MPTGKRWTRDELLLALNLYHKLTFGQMYSRQPAIVAMAAKLNRGSNSLAMKLCNFASLDPALKMRGIKGLSGASALDRSVWSEFHENLPEAAPASEQAFQELFGSETGNGVEVVPKVGIRPREVPVGSTDSWSNTKQRRGQDYFRDAVLNNFAGRCGVTGLAVREMLIASHILPWGKYEWQSTNRDPAPANQLWMIPLNTDIFCQKIEAVCDEFGYKKQTRAHNVAHLSTLVSIRAA